ncbi:UbiA family prenyltransferase [Streptomyces ovatisporus]|uniref:UbiA family prenyltransferase n=1 Tax=Streptomyces ovatisporus TaxID=1128682 RepID=A0ABV9A3J8_9ACTN
MSPAEAGAEAVAAAHAGDRTQQAPREQGLRTPERGGGGTGRRGPVRRGALRSAVRAHLETWRPYTLAYPGLVGLGGAALNGGSVPGGAHGAAPVLVAWAAPTLGWLSGHYLGDWFDRRLDAVSKPQRPLPSGRLSPRTALTCGVVCALASTGAAAAVNWRAVLLVGIAMLGIVAYSKVFKGRGLTGNAVRGSLTATTVLFGAMTVETLPSRHVLPFAVAFWFQDTASNLVGTLRDVDGDRAGGCRTVPVRHGVRVAVRAAALLHAVALAVALAALPLVPGDRGSSAVLLLCAVGCGTAAFLPLLRAAPGTLTPRRALRAHEILVTERMLLAGALLAGGWTLLPALAVVVPLSAVSLLAQARMRARHEFPPAEDASARTPHDGTRGDVAPW